MKEVVVRKVWAYNFRTEFSLMSSVLNEFHLVSFDTEFPGTVLEPEKPYRRLTRAEKFRSMVENVNLTKLIQLGICLSDLKGNLPSFGTENGYVWEFNFREFDQEIDAQNPTSIDLLTNQGIDLDKNKEQGIDARHFAHMFLSSVFGIYARAAFGGCGMVDKDPKITWVMFHSLYDLGYLIKLLNNQLLPDDQFQFITLVFGYFGFSAFDVKEIAYPFGLHGGLDKIAEILGVSRKGGKSHQAGSDSLLTMEVFLKLRQKHFNGEDKKLLQEFNHKLYGLNKVDFSDVSIAFREINHRRLCAAAQQNTVLFQRHIPRFPNVPMMLYPIARGPRAHRRFSKVAVPCSPLTSSCS